MPYFVEKHLTEGTEGNAGNTGPNRKTIRRIVSACRRCRCNGSRRIMGQQHVQLKYQLVYGTFLTRAFRLSLVVVYAIYITTTTQYHRPSYHHRHSTYLHLHKQMKFIFDYIHIPTDYPTIWPLVLVLVLVVVVVVLVLVRPSMTHINHHTSPT